MARRHKQRKTAGSETAGSVGSVGAAGGAARAGGAGAGGAVVGVGVVAAGAVSAHLDVDWMFTRRARRAIAAFAARSGLDGAAGEIGTSPRLASAVDERADDGETSALELSVGRECGYARVRGKAAGARRRGRVPVGQLARAAPERDANSRVVMNCVEPDDGFRLVQTRDPADRAHRQRVPVKSKEGGIVDLYVPAADRRGRPSRNLFASPRRYDRSQITSRGVAFDSMFDGLYHAQRRLAGIRGLGRGPTVAEERTSALAHLDGVRPGLSRAVTARRVHT